MPLPTTPPKEARRRHLTPTPLKKNEKKEPTSSLAKFIQQELKYWQDDLKQKQSESGYYLEWLDWSEAGATEIKRVDDFRDLVNNEIPSLLKLVYALSSNLSDPDMEQLLLAQRTYVAFCSRYDRVRLKILGEINWRSSFRIF